MKSSSTPTITTEPDGLEYDLRIQHDEGDADATLLLGQYLLTGAHGVQMNPSEGIQLLKRLAGNPFRPPHAVAGAKYVLGEAYRLGVGVPRDPAQSVDWYRQAQEGGLLIGVHYVGWYLTGLMPEWTCEKPDLEAAQRYFEAGAQEGCSECAAALAMLHLEQMVAHPNANEGCRWLRVAAKAGHPIAVRAVQGQTRWHAEPLCDSTPSTEAALQAPANP